MGFELETFHRNVPDQELLDDLVAAHAKILAAGESLTFRSYNEIGRYSPSAINERSGSWNIALQRAGIAPSDEKNIPIETLFDNLRVVWIAKGRQPVYRDMKRPPSEYSGSTYAARFGGWRMALAKFVALVQQEQSQPTSFRDKKRITKSTARSPRDPSLSLRFLVLKRDNFRCVTCGRSPATVQGLILEVDHILAWSNGGETTLENLQALCFECNRGTSNG
jgi:5-methylcytosine-specific restriction endonuclease McrA